MNCDFAEHTLQGQFTSRSHSRAAYNNQRAYQLIPSQVVDTKLIFCTVFAFDI